MTTWLWYTVQRQDRIERPEIEVETSRYVIALVVSVAAMLVSAVLPVAPRLIAWAAVGGGWILLVLLLMGFGLWWIYFDVVGGRLPNHDGRAVANWIASHCPITLSISAAGVGMISLIEHAHARAYGMAAHGGGGGWATRRDRGRGRPG